MTSALHLALRGLFSLNAITLAVQGLIESQALQPAPVVFSPGFAGRGGGPDAELSLSDYLRRFGRADALPAITQQAAQATASQTIARAKQRRRRNAALLAICEID